MDLQLSSAVGEGEIEDLAADLGIDYRQDARLDGWRSLDKEQDAASPDTWWEVAAFGAYAHWTRGEEFRRGLAELLSAASGRRTAIMCSEAVWWRCHRRIISDIVKVQYEVPVEQLMRNGRLTEHPVSDGARAGDDGRLVWGDGLSA